MPSAPHDAVPVSERSAFVSHLGTALPPWGAGRTRVAGPDEDTVTLAVAAGLAAIGEPDERAAGASPVTSCVFVSCDPPLLEGGNGPVLLAGLGLPNDVDVVERLGGAAAALDAVTGAAPGTLVIGADAGEAAGAAAVLVGSGSGALIRELRRVNRSLPVRARGRDGVTRDDDDPRLERERGSRASLDAAGIDPEKVVLVGLAAKDAKGLGAGTAIGVATRGASAPLFALAELFEGEDRTLAGLDQARLTAVTVVPGPVVVHRDEPVARALPDARAVPGPDLRIVLSAYDRAFDARLRLEAARCRACGTLSYPPRLRCLDCGSEARTEAVALPRAAAVYTVTTVHVPVPGMQVPYSLAVVELGGSGVRLLAPVTGVVPGSVVIGDRGQVVFRRLSVRSGVPDYGYAFRPGEGGA